jgi:hypothetical protein
MTMTGPFVEHGIRILAAVVLLAIMSSPMRTIGVSQTASPVDLAHNLVILDHGHAGEPAMWARPSLRPSDSLPSDIEDELDAEIEDELTAKSLPATVSGDVPPSPCPGPHCERVGVAVAIAARPLRC